MSEVDLFNAGVGRRHRGPVDVRVEPCACGGVVRATALDDKTVTAAVRAHNGTQRHQRWSMKEGL